MPALTGTLKDDAFEALYLDADWLTDYVVSGYFTVGGRGLPGTAAGVGRTAGPAGAGQSVSLQGSGGVAAPAGIAGGLAPAGVGRVN